MEDHGEIERGRGDEPYASWWHEDRPRLGLGLALDVTLEVDLGPPYHPVAIHAHARLGRVVTIGRRVAAIERDATRREMLVHVPAFGLPRPPRTALLVGLTDPWTVGELLRHQGLERLVVVEDGASLRGLLKPLGLAADLADQRVALRTETPLDALEALSRATGGDPLDLVLVQAGALTSSALDLDGWVQAAAAILAADGVLVETDGILLTRAGARWLGDADDNPRTLRAALAASSRLRPAGRYLATSPHVPSGFLGYTAWSSGTLTLERPRRDAMDRLTYNAAMHRAAFSMPQCLQELP